MANINVRQAFAALTGNGTTVGYVTVASNAEFYPTAHVWLVGDTAIAKEYIITDLVSTDKIGLRAVPIFGSGAPNYGRSDVSAYTTADNATISQEPQVVRVNQPTFAKINLL